MRAVVRVCLLMAAATLAGPPRVWPGPAVGLTFGMGTRARRRNRCTFRLLLIPKRSFKRWQSVSCTPKFGPTAPPDARCGLGQGLSTQGGIGAFWGVGITPPLGVFLLY